MDISYWASSARSWTDIVDGCRWAETQGWHGVWVPDHFMPDVGDAASSDAELGPVHEAWTLQAAIAASVPRVRVGAMVAGTTYRHPAVVAKMAATIDHISGGRFVLGLGAGWQLNEHRHYGLDLGSPAERSDRLEEACHVISGLLHEDRTSFDGEYYRLDDAPCEPKPVQERLPLLVAGRGERRTLRTVARFADEWNAWALADEVPGAKAVLRRWCDEIDRDVDDIRITVAAFVHICDTDDEAGPMRDALAHRGGLVGTVDQLRRAVADYASAGVSELVIPDFLVDPDRRDELLGRFQVEVMDA
ncbi:MAG: TIGR03560 family F420-dependent LLM class oxidoreductase [Acidimicrobiia bacterium]|nr:TIGR03560 family F420-dependent LLM class oxidoreductase [Acidimicrobiia bacterium]